jgi:hypothetical protein
LAIVWWLYEVVITSARLLALAEERAAYPRVVIWLEESAMATAKQSEAARRNIKKAQAAASQKRTIAHLPESTRRALGQQAAAGRRRHGSAGHALEDRNRQQLYELARERDIAGRSRMGKGDLIEAIRKS